MQVRHSICRMQVSGIKGNVPLTAEKVSVYGYCTVVDNSKITPNPTLRFASYSQVVKCQLYSLPST